MSKIEELRNAHAQGFLSDADFERKLAELTDSPPVNKNDSVKDWLISLFIKAINSCSNEQDKIDVLTWLANARETLADESLTQTTKLTRLYKQLDFKKTISGAFNGLSLAIKNYCSADLPLAVKWAIPVTLAAATVVGGEAVGIAGFGGAIGLPVLLLVFVGTAGITAILQAFFDNETSNYVGVVLALIAQDEVLRRVKKSLYEAMQAKPSAPKRQPLPDDAKELQAALLALSPI